MSISFVPRRSSLNSFACVLVGTAYLTLLSLFVWAIFETEIPMLANAWHR